MAPTPFTPAERSLIQDTHFFQTKAVITKKVKRMLEELHAALKEELLTASLLAPEGVDTTIGQFVKGEHLHDFPYQYLDFPKYFSHTEKFTFRSLFWWGHHFVFALILEGPQLDHYKQNLLKAYDQLSDQGLYILMAPTLWEWERRPELLLEIRKDNREVIEETLATRPFLKIHRFIDFENPVFERGSIAEEGVKTFRLMKIVVSL
jgi:hypothetical protein